jgi:glutathione S-transferase
MVSPDDAEARRELLLLAPSIRVPCLTHDGARVWNTMAIAQYLDETCPGAGLFPADRVARAHCRSVCGEMNSGFANLRSSLPMNLKARPFCEWNSREAMHKLCRIAALQRSNTALACGRGRKGPGPERGLAPGDVGARAAIPGTRR